jgi:hypothetical protein
MTRYGSLDTGTWPIAQPPTSRQSWSALTAVAVLVLAFGALVPFAGAPLPHLNGFIPAIDAMIFVTDFITSILLFSQFSIYPSRALLALASGYLFTALIVIPHALSFPGAFPPTENIGGGIQTTIRLYLIWHLALPATLLVYVWLNNKNGTNDAMRLSSLSAIALSAASVLCLVCGFVWLAIAGDKFMPSLLCWRPKRTWPSVAVGYLIYDVNLRSRAGGTVGATTVSTQSMANSCGVSFVCGIGVERTVRKCAF